MTTTFRTMAIAFVAVAIGGCGGGSSGGVDITGTTVTLEGDRVDSPCFSFDVPEGYELNPYSEECRTSVRLINGDSLSEITIVVVKQEKSIDEFFATVEDMAAEGDLGDVRKETLTIAGQPAGAVYLNNSIGASIVYYHIPIARGAFVSDGESITGLEISGPTWEGGFTEAIDEIVDSLEIHL